FSKAVVSGEALPDGRARVHTESLLRPLRRRAESTARPERVRMRTRNPWVRLRRRLLGWSVRLMGRRNPRGQAGGSQENKPSAFRFQPETTVPVRLIADGGRVRRFRA